MNREDVASFHDVTKVALPWRKIGQRQKDKRHESREKSSARVSWGESATEKQLALYERVRNVNSAVCIRPQLHMGPFAPFIMCVLSPYKFYSIMSCTPIILVYFIVVYWVSRFCLISVR